MIGSLIQMGEILCGDNLQSLWCEPSRPQLLEARPLTCWPLLAAVNLMVVSDGLRRTPLVRGNESSICCSRNAMVQTVWSFPAGAQEFRHLWNSLYSFQSGHQSSVSVSAEMPNRAEWKKYIWLQLRKRSVVVNFLTPRNKQKATNHMSPDLK